MPKTTNQLITAAPQSSSHNAALTEASASTQKDMSEPLSQKKQKQDKADKKLKQLIRETLPKPKRNTPARTPDRKQRGKEKSVPNTNRQSKGSDDPIRQHNRFSTLDMGSGRVVRWCWVNLQCRGVPLIWIEVGQGPTALAVGGGC